MGDATLEALEEQTGCYRRLAKLAAAQHEHVQQAHTEALLGVLLQRQEALDRISALETSIAPRRRQWNDYVGGLSAVERQQAETLMGEIRVLLEEITSADRNDAMILQQQKLNLGRAIGQATAARQVNRSYAASAYGRRPGGMDVQR